MRTLLTAAALVAAATMIGIAGLAQTAVDPKTPQDVCNRLAVFLTERGGRVQAAATPITLEEVHGYMREDNRFACRHAISIMYTHGVNIPPALLDEIGIPVDKPAGATPQ